MYAVTATDATLIFIAFYDPANRTILPQIVGRIAPCVLLILVRATRTLNQSTVYPTGTTNTGCRQYVNTLAVFARDDDDRGGAFSLSLARSNAEAILPVAAEYDAHSVIPDSRSGARAFKCVGQQ